MEKKTLQEIMQEQNRKQKEGEVYNLLREKFELERQVRVGESAAIQIKGLDKRINKHYTQLANSLLEA